MGMISRQKDFMKTVITFHVIKGDSKTVDVQNAIEEGFYEFERIVKSFTRFEDTSELSNLNRNSGKWVSVSKELFELVEFMLKMSGDTDGAFDPTIIDFLEVYGYDKNYDFSKLDNPKLDEFVKKIADERPSWKEIKLDEKNSRIKLAENQRIDLGGIGKGYAVDCAFEKLSKVSSNFIIDAGGDIRTSGLNEKSEPWQVGLKAKNKDGVEETVGIVELSNYALASSGSWSRKVKQFHHLIDSRSGKPIETDYSTVFVTAQTSMLSDAWATAIFVLGEDSEKYAPDSIEFMFV
jgi:thiamine biosynthesis lipoprotein